MKNVVIYTDGGCIGNPGPGGYGVVLIHAGVRRELTGGYRLTTNNRMELTAAIQGLSVLDEACTVQLYSDSRYLVDAVTKGWLNGWRTHGWRKSDRQKVLNVDLWQQFAGLLERHQVNLTWVEGHSGDPNNERCDRLSRRAAAMKDLPQDLGYENTTRNPSLF
jgi:ribonuclease HI